MRRAVVPLVRAGHAVVDELVAGRLPGLSTVIRSLDELTEPAARLRGVDATGIGRGTLEVVDLPAREVRAADVPGLAPTVRRQDERALSRPYQHSHTAHRRLLLAELKFGPAYSILHRPRGAGKPSRLLGPKRLDDVHARRAR